MVCRLNIAYNGRGLLLLAKVSKLIALRHANSNKPMLADVNSPHSVLLKFPANVSRRGLCGLGAQFITCNQNRKEQFEVNHNFATARIREPQSPLRETFAETGFYWRVLKYTVRRMKR